MDGSSRLVVIIIASQRVFTPTSRFIRCSAIITIVPLCPLHFQDPAGIFELIEVVGNGTYGQVYKVSRALLTR